MTVARSVADVLTEHVRFQVECIDRMFLNVYVPQLQYPAGLIGYVQRQLGLPIASTAPLAKITDAFCTAVHRFARDNGLRHCQVEQSDQDLRRCVLVNPQVICDA